MNREECADINRRLKNSSTHGMAMIYHKIWAIYGDKMKFDFTQNENMGMKVSIGIPMEQGR